ncbi:hypothetical protein Avbf_01191, partial [Armadillidium vulgare]
DFSPYDPSYVVICTLDSIDSIKSLKRSPQHIFVECSYHAIIELNFIRNYKFMHILIVLGPRSGFRVPVSGFPSSGVQFPCFEFRVENPIPRHKSKIITPSKLRICPCCVFSTEIKLD